jgi:anti-sigma regulatory factor (Ser/Thr protein kinase)
VTVLARSSLTIAPTALAVRDVGGWLRESIAVIDADSGAALFSRAELAVHEACMNVIDHGDCPQGSSIQLDLELEERYLSVMVTDRGRPFDFDRVPLPDPQVPQPRGYGVKIMKSLASEITYQRAGSTNELVLRFDLKEHP